MRNRSRALLRRRVVVPTLIGVVLAALLYTTAPGASPTPRRRRVATYRDGTLRLSVPYDDAIARTRTFGAEVPPDDKPGAAVSKTVAPSRDARPWEVSLEVGKDLALEDLLWHRVKIGAGEAARVVSLSEILRLPVVRILAQRSYAAGSRASLRVIAADSKTGDPLRDSRVKLELVNGDSASTLFEGRLTRSAPPKFSFTLRPRASAAQPESFGPRRRSDGSRPRSP